MRPYTVEYRETVFDVTKKEVILARCKSHAFDIAMWNVLPKKLGHYPYDVVVVGVTYNNGNYRSFV